MMKLLSIGSHFSADAQRLLFRVGLAGGKGIFCQNLNIGENAPSIAAVTDAVYDLERNGANCLCKVGREQQCKISVEEALEQLTWDIVTLDACHDTPVSVLSELAAYIRLHCPSAKLYLHQTWGEKTDQVVAFCKKAAEALNVDGIIPSGAVMQGLQDAGATPFLDDGNRAGRGLGCVAIGLTWCKTFFGSDFKIDTEKPLGITGNLAKYLAEPVTPEEYVLAEQCAARAVCEG